MTQIMKFNNSVIITILGIGYINSGMILDDIGDIQRFSSPSKLLAFANLAPSVYQSDSHSARHMNVQAKLQSAKIRTHQRSIQCCKEHALFKTNYDKKMAEGRTLGLTFHSRSPYFSYTTIPNLPANKPICSLTIL